MCMHKKQKNKYNVLNSYAKYKLNEIENYKIENFHDGNILTIFLISWPFSS